MLEPPRQAIIGSLIRHEQAGRRVVMLQGHGLGHFEPTVAPLGKSGVVDQDDASTLWMNSFR